MYKRIFFHSLTAGLLAALAGKIYNRIYFFATEADFFNNIKYISDYSDKFIGLHAGRADLLGVGKLVKEERRNYF